MIDELLKHIGIDHRPDRDAAGLAAVHRAYVSRLAYDGITAQLGEHAPIDPMALVERSLTTGRGGYCFEINTILLTLLRDLGFEVERREAVVDEREAFAGGAPTNHLALVATTEDGARWLCDAGWGEGPLEPLPLAAGTYERGPLSWTLEREADGSGWWVTQHAWGSTPGFHMGDAAVGLDAFAPHHQRLATDPDSSFVRTLVVQQPGADRVTTLRARTLSVTGPDVGDIPNVVVSSEDELATTLEGVFGIDAAALGAERTARLWTAACAQHEAFLARRD